jgi:hypothetical protein
MKSCFPKRPSAFAPYVRGLGTIGMTPLSLGKGQELGRQRKVVLLHRSRSSAKCINLRFHSALLGCRPGVGSGGGIRHANLGLDGDAAHPRQAHVDRVRLILLPYLDLMTATVL